MPDAFRSRCAYWGSKDRELRVGRPFANSLYQPEVFAPIKSELKTMRDPLGYSRGSGLLQFRVLGLGLLQDGDVGVGVFPQRQEILIRGAGFRRIARQNEGAAKTKVRQRAYRRIHNNVRMIQNLLKLRNCFLSPVRRKIRLSVEVGRGRRARWRAPNLIRNALQRR